MKNYSRAYGRKASVKKALRKKRIAEEIYGRPWYDNLHQYSKNTVHCSCECCSAKTRNKGHGKKLNYKACDLRKILSMDYQLLELAL